MKAVVVGLVPRTLQVAKCLAGSVPRH